MGIPTVHGREHVKIVRRSLLVASLFTTISLVSACAGAAPSKEGDAAAPGYPRTIENCGRMVTVDAPPQRAVSLNQSSTEIMLSLGLADRMVGTATWTDPVREELAEANAGVPRLADNEPSFERVLAQEPDFVSASFQSTYATVASREDFAKLGVPAYLSPADCVHKSNAGSGDGARSQPLRMETIYDEIRNLATIFDVRQRGAELIASLKQRVRQATAGMDSSASMLYWFANSQAPYMAGCCGAPGIITRAVGATNVFDDTHKEWPQVSWETVTNRNPDVLVLGDLSRRRQSAESGQRKIQFLESHPVAKHMDAVQNDRYILLSGAAMNPSIRTVDGIEKVAAALRKFGVAN